MRNELFSASGAEVSFWHRRQVGGMSLPAYLLVSALVLLAAVTGALPSNMVGALAVMLVLGNLFDFIGGHIPIVRSYLGGAVFCIFAASAAATFGLLPASVTENCTHFINDVGFLDFFISTLITGSILGMDRELLKRAAVRFLPVTFLSMACAAAVAGLVGAATGQGFRETVLYIAMPMMSGGMGAGVVPLSGIYADAAGLDKAAIVSQMIPASTIGNVLAILCAALAAKLGRSIPAWDGHGRLMDQTTAAPPAAPVTDPKGIGAGLLLSLAFFILGSLVSKVFPGIHAYAFMILLVVLCKVLGLVPSYYEQCAVRWSQFAMKNLTNGMLAGVGIAMLDLKVLVAAITPRYLLICASSVLTVALCAGLFGKWMGFYPVESAITAGLCTNSMGGTGNIAVLSAADRMELIPFAQIATRLGGACILIVSSFLVRLL